MSGLFRIKLPNPNSLIGMPLQTSLYGLPIPIIYGKARVPGNLIWMPEPPKNVNSGGKSHSLVNLNGQQQVAPAAIALCEGPISAISDVWISSPPAVDFTAKLVPEGWGVMLGTSSQTEWPAELTKHPEQALRYPNVAYVFNTAVGFSSGVTDNYNWEVTGLLSFGSFSIVDANPVAALVDMLTDVTHGLQWPTSKIASTTFATSYVVSAGLFSSLVLDTQQPASSYAQELLTVANCAAVWSDGVLKIVPYGDSALSGNGATFTPNTTPLYDLTDNDYLAGQGEEPIQVTRKTSTETYNQLYVEFQDRFSDYNTNVVEAKIEADISVNGLKPAPKITLHSVKDLSTARHVAQLLLQRIYTIRNTYQFKLGWRYSLLEPMDLVTLTDPGLGLSFTPVRITEIVELEGEKGFQVTAEEWPFGTATATLYSTQGAEGQVSVNNADPGNTSTPVIFEGPFPLASSPLEIWIAASGASANWGGCEVWLSTDNVTFYQVGTILGAASYGVTTASLPSAAALPSIDTTDTLSVDLTNSGGSLDSGSANDVPALLTLCYLDKEFLSYETATLTSALHYNLTTLGRGAFNSPVPSSHASGATFVRCTDQGLCKLPFPQGTNGQVIYIKLPAFNLFGRAQQDVSAVSSFSHTISVSTLPAPAIPQGTVSIDASGNWEATVDAPSNALSFKWLSSTSGYPSDASTISSGTVASAPTFSISGGPLTFGQTVFITVVPFTGAAGGGAALTSIHIRGAYLTYTASKTATYAATSWGERSPFVQYGLDWTAITYPQNPALPFANTGVGVMYAWLFPILPAGITLVQASVIASWDTAAVPLGTFSVGVYTNGVSTNVGSVTYAGGVQTVNMSLSGTLATASSLMCIGLWNGPVSGADASARQASLRDVAITYTMPTPDKTL